MSAPIILTVHIWDSLCAQCVCESLVFADNQRKCRNCSVISKDSKDGNSLYSTWTAQEQGITVVGGICADTENQTRDYTRYLQSVWIRYNGMMSQTVQLVPASNFTATCQKCRLMSDQVTVIATDGTLEQCKSKTEADKGNHLTKYFPQWIFTTWYCNWLRDRISLTDEVNRVARLKRFQFRYAKRWHNQP